MTKKKRGSRKPSVARNSGADDMWAAFAHGCPSCGEEGAEYETLCSVNDIDNVPCVICDACGHAEYDEDVLAKKSGGPRKNARKPMSDFVVSDAGPSTADRYTIWYTRPVDGAYHYFGMSAHPSHPQGFGQHGSERAYGSRKKRSGWAGKKISFDQLPPDAQRAALAFVAEFDVV